MSRIARAFADKFRELLAGFGARERDKGVRLLFEKAAALAETEGLSHSQGLVAAAAGLARKASRFRRSRGQPQPPPPRIFCDAGLGGLARWLRAAGRETFWIQDITDGRLVSEARRLGAVIITTDSLLLDRRPIAQGEVRAVWVPPTVTKHEQLELVRAELDLPPAEPRCMRCGGALREVPKDSVRARIPPRTWRWVDEYFLCEKCGQLYWHGTHWRSVRQKLSRTAPEESLVETAS